MLLAPADRSKAGPHARPEGYDREWMPTVLWLSGYRFFFFSLEGSEPPHIHVERGDSYAKLWLSSVSLARSKGFRSSEISEIMEIVRAHKSLFQDRWDEHFKR